MTADEQAGGHPLTRLLLVAVAVLQVARRHDVTVLAAYTEHEGGNE